MSDPAPLTLAAVRQLLDHALLQPALTDAELRAGCEQAAGWGVKSVCIKPYAVPLAAEVLAGSGVLVGTVIGFPQGGHTTAVKRYEAEAALRDGAAELDVVVNVGKVRSGDWGYVAADVRAVVDVAHAAGALVKVIFENSMLLDEHKVRLCEVCGVAGADFVKTATGYGDGGATDHDLALMRRHAPPAVGVKASGGVRTFARLAEVVRLGVTRVGTSSSGQIVEEARAVLGESG